ncbi:MAG: biotin--[acetyl-CoA-carboxylase] ligase [Motilibacteraceae bacterium]
MSPGPYSDLSRPPLRQASLARGLLVPGGLWTSVRVVPVTGSTNADVAAAASRGEPEGLVLVAEEQRSGRGRLDRVWQMPARAGLLFSVLLRPPLEPARWGWLPLLAGVACAEAVESVTGVEAALKWPNDVMVGERKLAGILAERRAGDGGADALVLGIGLNVSLSGEELPVPTATSLALETDEPVDRDPVLRAVLRALEHRYRRFVGAGGDPERSRLLEEYRARCATIGREVRVLLPADRELRGRAVDVDGEGRLVVEGPDGPVPVAAGDVVHVR